MALEAHEGFHNGFCEVCQKEGKVLFCECCTRAFHVACIARFVDLESLGVSERWRCPVCVDGEDFLLRGFKKPQLTQDEMEEKKREHNEHCKRIKAASERKLYQTFLQAIDDIAPFAKKKALTEIRKAEASSLRRNPGRAQAAPPLDLCQLDPRSHTPEMYKDVLAEGIQLKKYQAEGVGWMIQGFFNRGGGILADDMGLGKTLMTLTFLSYLKVKAKLNGPVLVVVPLSCAGNWLREARKFVPHLSIAKVCGTAKEKEFSLEDNEIWYGMKDIIVTTYETVPQMIGEIGEKGKKGENEESRGYLGQMCWKAVILDEAHRAKNVRSNVSTALEKTASSARFLLTGTPLQNNLKELHALLKFLWPSVLADQSEIFENAILLPELQQRADANSKACINEVMVEKIRGLLAIGMKRRKKEEVLLLPPKIFHDVWLPMTPLQAQWYRRILSLKNTQMSRDIRSLKKLILRLRSVCVHPRLALTTQEDVDFLTSMGVCTEEEADQLRNGPMVSDEIIRESFKLMFVDRLLTHLHAHNMGLNENWRREHEARMGLKNKKKKDGQKWLEEAAGIMFLDDMKFHHMEQVDGKEHAGFLSGMDNVDWDTPHPHKVLIFCQYISSLDFLEEYCTLRGYRYMRMDGSTNRVLRELDMRDFNAPDEDIFIYLISTRAGGLGINLAAANHVIMFEQDWNPHVDHQAIDRAHRIGQSRKVHIHRPVQEWAVEERLLIRSAAKLEMENRIIDDKELEDEKESSEDQLKADEIVSILNNGESAFKEFNGDNFHYHLKDFFDRKRAPMPEVTDHSPLRPPRPLKSKVAPPPPVPDDFIRSGSGRVVKRKLTYAEEFCKAPVKKTRKVEIIKLKHMCKCFTCGVKDERQLTPCSTCPMSYHQGCVGHTPKKWSCPWHHCASCNRTANEVGGMLIHCLECPSALCYDCFPPNFRRVHPPESFWSEMKKRGWNATPQKMVFFKCNSCRTLEEQQRRLTMRAEDLAAQQDEKLRAALEEKRNLEAQKQRRASEKTQRIMADFAVHSARKALADVVVGGRTEILKATAKLWPKAFWKIWEDRATRTPKDISAALIGRKATPPSKDIMTRPLETCSRCGIPCHKGRDCPFEFESPTKGRVGSTGFTVSLTDQQREERIDLFNAIVAELNEEDRMPEPEQVQNFTDDTPAWIIVQAYRRLEATLREKLEAVVSRVSPRLVIVPKEHASEMKRQQAFLKEAARADQAKAAAAAKAVAKAAKAQAAAAAKAAAKAAKAQAAAAAKAAAEAAKAQEMKRQQALLKEAAVADQPKPIKLHLTAPNKGQKEPSPELIKYISEGPAAGWHVKGRKYPSTVTMWVLPPNSRMWLSRHQALQEKQGQDPAVIEAVDRVRWQVQHELRNPPPPPPPAPEGPPRKVLKLSRSDVSTLSSSSTRSVRVLN